MLGILLPWALIAIRIFAVAMTAPVFGNRAIGFWIRCGLAICLTAIAIPIAPCDYLADSSDMIELGLREALLGAAIGFGMSILFRAASMAGSIVGQLAGIQLFEQDQGELSGSPLARYFSIVSIAVFVSLGGVESVVSGLLDSFVALPVGTEFSTHNAINLLTNLCQQSFLLVVRCIAPAVASMLIASYALGMLNRSFPGLNSMGIGLTSNVAIITLAVFLTLGGTMWLFITEFQSSSDWIQGFLRSMSLQ